MKEQEDMFPIWYPLFVLSVLGLAIYVAYHNYPWWDANNTYDHGAPEKYGFGIIGLMLTMLACGIACALASFLSGVIGDGADQVWHNNWTGQMVSMRGADGIQGSFSSGIFMSSGYVQSKQVYYYYIRNADGSFAPNNWTADKNVTIYEEDRTDGIVHQFEKRFKRPWVAWFAENDGQIAMDFHVPKGSIHQKFELK